MNFFNARRPSRTSPASRGYPFAVLDVETTGLWAEGTDRIIEVGIVLLDRDLNVESEYTTLVHPNRDVGATYIHGISGQDVVDAPPFAEIADDVEHHLMGRVVVGFNVSFDTRFLRAEFQRLGLRLPEIPTIDLRSFTDGTLDDACQTWGINPQERHRALGDARTTSDLLLAIARRNGIPSANGTPAETDEWPNLLRVPTEQHRSDRPPVDEQFEVPALNIGMALCFTGDGGLLLRGTPFTRDLVESTAHDAGFVVKSGISRKVDLVVAADIHSLSGKARKARELSIPIVPEIPFWRSLGYEVHR